MQITSPKKAAEVFNEWLRQWQENPTLFSRTEDEATVVSSQPHSYGERCVYTFNRIAREIENG
jgi:hypothetical protein